MEKQQIDVELVLDQVRNISEKTKRIPERSELNMIKDETLKAINDLKTNTKKHFNDSKLLLEDNARLLMNESNKIKEFLQRPSVSKEDLSDIQHVLSNELKMLNGSLHQLHTEVLVLQGERNDSQKLKELTNDNLQQIQVYFNDSQGVLDKYKEKLSDYEDKLQNLMLNKEKEENCCNNLTQGKI